MKLRNAIEMARSRWPHGGGVQQTNWMTAADDVFGGWSRRCAVGVVDGSRFIVFGDGGTWEEAFTNATERAAPQERSE